MPLRKMLFLYLPLYMHKKTRISWGQGTLSMLCEQQIAEPGVQARILTHIPQHTEMWMKINIKGRFSHPPIYQKLNESPDLYEDEKQQPLLYNTGESVHWHHHFSKACGQLPGEPTVV